MSDPFFNTADSEPIPENVVDLEAYRAPNVDAPQSSPETTELAPIDHFNHTSAALSIYDVSGLVMHRESIEYAARKIKPPQPLRERPDMELRGARDYYARYFVFATHRNPETGQAEVITDDFEAAKRIRKLLVPAFNTLVVMLNDGPKENIPEGQIDFTRNVIDRIVANIKRKEIWM